MFELIRKKIHSILRINKKNELKYENIKMCLTYAIIGFLWILFSDGIKNKLIKDSNMLLVISTYKSWLYVIVTSIILYVLTNIFVNKVNLTEKKLNESYEELSAVNEKLEAYVQQLTTSEKELRIQYDKIIESEEKYKNLANEMEHFRNIFEASSDGILIVSKNKVIDCNLAMVNLIGYDSKADIIGKNPIELSPEKQLDGELSKEKAFKIYKSVAQNGNYKFEWWYKRVDGRILPVEIMMTNILLNGTIVFHSLWRDISERKQMEDKMEYLSYHDQLTGLYNRRFFEEELIRIDVKKNLPISIIMGDVNGLKLINDSFGHSIGDKLLKKVAEVMSAGCRTDDIVARFGGDEFVILLPKTDNHEAKEIVKRIKEMELKEKVESIEISVSFGYETKKTDKEKIQDVLKKADDYMYEKKLLESQNMRRRTINAIITTLHGKDKMEEEHSHKVSMLCENMGVALGLSKDEIKDLKTVGLFSDIGKIAIDENIFNNPGKLTDKEWDEVKRHPEIGYRILSTVSSMSQMAEYVLAHHEKWNGTGYPKGLKGEEIPLQSRILAISDSYEAMISKRSYHNALTEKAAIEELKINAGLQFDPKLVRIFVEKVLKKPFDQNKMK